MTYHAFKAKRITSISTQAFGNDLHKFTGDQTSLRVNTDIGIAETDAPKPVRGKRVTVDLDHMDIEFTVTQLLAMPYWRSRLRTMVDAADEVASWDRTPQGGITPGIFDLDRNIKKHLDILDYGHEVCRTPHCQHKSHPERAPVNNVK